MIKPNKLFSKNSYINSVEQYQNEYDKSLENSSDFWAEKAKRIEWFQKWENVQSFDFFKGEIEWFKKGKLNASYNCIDRHIKNGHGNQIAIIWEGNDPNQSRKFTYNELLKEVCLFGNALRELGVKKGDRVKAKQPIGEIFTHPQTGKTTLQFSVFNELKPQNPKSWIYRM